MFELCEATLQSISRAFACGELTSLELTLRYLERIADLDREGPALNAVLEINPDAIDSAEALDREYAQSGPRGPLHGVPVLIKDNVSTKDKMHTSAGSQALAGNFAACDAHIVTRLREAGAVILGKTNLTELANFLADEMKNGFSSRGGSVLNPYGKDLDVGGSSSGSAVAVAANLCAVAVGTETSGSILNPANRNGIVGVKPTKGLVSRSGIVPICAAQDTAGPLARTVADAAALLTVLAGPDPSDPATGAIEPYCCDFTSFLDPEGLKGMRIGISRANFEELTPEHRTLAERAFAALKRAGAVTVDAPLPAYNNDGSFDVLLYEFKQCLNAYLASCPAPGAHNLAEIIAFNEAYPERCLRYGQAVALAAQEQTSGNLTEPAYLRCRIRTLRESRALVDGLLRERDLACIVMAGWNDVPPASGYPAVTVPIDLGGSGAGGNANSGAGLGGSGAPIGLTFVGAAFAEPVLFRAAYAFEQFFGGRVPPPIEKEK